MKIAWICRFVKLLLKEILQLSTPKETLLSAVGLFRELESVMQWIQLHKFEKITLDQLAEICHCAHSTFEKKFRRGFGISPGRYLLNLRLAAAESMLRDTNDSCALIAESCGFSDQFTFSRLFARRYGLPPREYLSKQLGLKTGYVSRILSLNSLAPDIVEAILAGAEPDGLSISQITEQQPIPEDWNEQRRLYGFPER